MHQQIVLLVEDNPRDVRLMQRTSAQSNSTRFGWNSRPTARGISHLLFGVLGVSTQFDAEVGHVLTKRERKDFGCDTSRS